MHRLLEFFRRHPLHAVRIIKKLDVLDDLNAREQNMLMNAEKSVEELGMDPDALRAA